jgi:hypothetical protein
MSKTDIDWTSLTKEEIKEFEKHISKAKKRIANAHKNQFLSDVVKLSVDRGVRWSEAKALMSSYVPSNDAEAKKLGFKCKRVDENNVTHYYARKVKKSVEI